LKLGDPPPFGGRMPPAGPLDAPTFACVRAWVAATAAEDAGAYAYPDDASRDL
jgi:hypothetical protein